MDYNDIIHMPDDEYQRVLLDFLYDDPDFIMNVSKGHAKGIHVGKTDIELYSRIIKEKKDNITSFNDIETLTNSLQDIIDYKSDEITDWIMKNPKEFENRRDYNEIAISLDLKENIGYGFKKGDLSKKECSGIRIVLSRDKSGESPLGFYLKTAYPDINISKSTDIQLNLLFAINCADKNKLFTPVEKLMIAAQKMGLDAGVGTIDGEQELRIYAKNDDLSTTHIFMKENYFKIKLSNLTERENIDMTKLDSINPNLYKEIVKLNNIRQKINEKKTIKEEDIAI